MNFCKQKFELSFTLEALIWHKARRHVPKLVGSIVLHKSLLQKKYFEYNAFKWAACSSQSDSCIKSARLASFCTCFLTQVTPMKLKFGTKLGNMSPD